MEAGNIWLGFFMFYSVFVLILFPIIKAVIKNKKKGDNSLIGKAFQFAFLGAFAIMAAGLIHAQQPKLVNYDVELANASAKGEKVKIVLLADLHLSVNAVLSAAIFFSKNNRAAACVPALSAFISYLLTFIIGLNMYLLRISTTMKPRAIPRQVTRSVIPSDTAISCSSMTMQYIM